MKIKWSNTESIYHFTLWILLPIFYGAVYYEIQTHTGNLFTNFKFNLINKPHKKYWIVGQVQYELKVAVIDGKVSTDRTKVQMTKEIDRLQIVQ